jgi:hypothetical protein
MAQQNGLEHAIHGDFLVVPKRFPWYGKVGGQESVLHFLRVQIQMLVQPRPELVGRWERRQLAFEPREKIVFDDAVSVRGIGKFQVECLSVFLGLLHAIAWLLVGRLGLDDGDHQACAESEQVIGAFLRFTEYSLSGHDDAAIRERALLADLVIRPAGGIKLRKDVLPAGISFG